MASKFSMSDFVKQISDFKEARQAKVARANEREQSENITRDDQNRLHAPHNDFKWIDGEVYSAGAYLPEESSSSDRIFAVKVKVAVSSFDQILKEVPKATVGKKWDQNGVTVAYANVPVPESLYRKLNPMKPASGKRLVTTETAKEQGLRTGATWKYNMRSVTKQWNDPSSLAAEFFEIYMEERGLVWDENLFMNKKSDGTYHNPKNKKAALYSPLAGKEVGYIHLPDYLI